MSNSGDEPSDLHKAVCLDCQPKSLDDATYVSFSWLKRVLELAHQGYRLKEIRKFSESQKP